MSIVYNSLTKDVSKVYDKATFFLDSPAVKGASDTFKITVSSARDMEDMGKIREYLFQALGLVWVPVIVTNPADIDKYTQYFHRRNLAMKEEQVFKTMISGADIVITREPDESIIEEISENMWYLNDILGNEYHLDSFKIHQGE